MAAATTERFVGRDREVDAVMARCAAAMRGHGSVTVVSGEPGIGKTRFGHEVATRAAAAGLRVVTARCWTDGGAPPLWPWQPILRQLGGDSAAEVLAADDRGAVADADRFPRFTAVVDHLAAACSRAPACLVVDDVHAADAGTLLLVRFVARSLHGLGLALILTRRSGEPAEDSTEGRIVDDIEREATPVMLRRFTVDESRTLLAEHGLRNLDPSLLAALVKVTGGNPLFLRRVAALGAPEWGGSLPVGLNVAIDQALSQLTPTAQDALRRAAVLGPEPSVAEAAAVIGQPPVVILDAVRHAAAAGLVTSDRPDRFAFTHELVRSNLEEGLPPAHRLDAHAAAAAVVAEGGGLGSGRLARRAHHARVAAARSADDARLAVAACEEAAEAMVRSLAYEQADTLLSAAVDLHQSAAVGPAPARLVVAWARAALRCGRLTEARQRFEWAAAAAERDHDPVALADAALGLGGHWVNEHRAPVERARVLGLQRSALDALPEGHTPLACRLRGRLAAEDVFDGGPIEPVLDALDAAQRCGDPVALAEVLSFSHHALFNTEHSHRCQAMAEELIQVASEAGDGVLALMGLCWRAADLFVWADERAPRALEELRERATALANQNILWLVGVMDVMLLIREGRLAEAEAAAARCRDHGVEVGETDSVGYFAAHLVVIRWLQGGDAGLREVAEHLATSPLLSKTEFSFHASAAVILAQAGEQGIARSVLDRLAAEGLAALPQSSTWLVGMAAIAELAAVLDAADVAREVYALLRPHADRPLIASLAVVCAGSTERSLGLAALTAGDSGRAVDHLERAVEANHRLGHRPATAIALAQLASALRHRNGSGDHERAVTVLGQAVALAERAGLAVRATAWRRELATLAALPGAGGSVGEPAKSPSEQVRAAGPRCQPRRLGAIRRDGRRWVVALDDRQARVADLVGMRYLADLLTHPGEARSALTLVGHQEAVHETTPQELLDDQARAAYAARVRELSQDLAEAEAGHDIGRAERLRAELDAIVDELEAATGLAARPRRFADPAERARTAVRKAIKRAVDAVADADAELGRLLRATVETGHACRYRPDPDAPVTWSAADRPPADTSD